MGLIFIRFHLCKKLEKKTFIKTLYGFYNRETLKYYTHNSKTLKWLKEVVMCLSLTTLQNPREYLSGIKFIRLRHGLGREQMIFQPPFLYFYDFSLFFHLKIIFHKMYIQIVITKIVFKIIRVGFRSRFYLIRKKML